LSTGSGSPRGKLLTGAVGPTLLRLTGPMALGLVSIILFNVIDTFWVAQLGGAELAAMSFTFPVIVVVMSVAMGIGVGVTSVISRAIGEGDDRAVRRLATDGLILANVAVVAVAFGGLATVDPLFRLLGAGDELRPMIREYMQLWYLGVGFVVIPMVGNSAIRATGDTRTPGLVMVVAGLANAVLDPFLIFGIGPFPRLELEGAALATVLSFVITFAAAIWVLARRERMLDLSVPRPRETWASWKRILYVGVPSAATSMLIPLATGILTRLVAGYGPSAVAAYGVGTRIDALGMIGVTAMASAITPLVGQNFGAGRCDRVRGAIRFAILFSLGYGVVLALGLWALAEPVARLFSDEEPVVALIVRYLRLVPVSYGLYGWILLVNAVFNAVNRPLRSTLLIVLRLFVVAVPLALVGSALLGVPGIFAAVAVGNASVGLVAVFLVRRFVTRVEDGEVDVAPVGAARSLRPTSTVS